MKKIAIYILITIASISFLSAKELLNFTLENRSSVSGEYTADLYIDISGGSWVVGPSTIVIKFNTAGLTKKSTATVTNIDTELANAGYYLTKSSYSDGEIAVNIIASDQNVTKSSKFRICTIDWAIDDGDQMDNLQFDEIETVIYKSLDLMDYNCSTSNCYTLTNPVPQRIIPRMDPPVLTTPANTATKINLFVDFDWQNIADATGYEMIISDKSDFSTILVSTSPSTDSYSLARGTLDYNKTYYWKVRAYNTDETTYWSNAWSFSTRSPLAKVTDLNPADLSSGIKLYPVLSYSAVTDADTYVIQLSDASNFSNLIIYEEISGTQLTSSIKLDYFKKYYWRVKAKDHFGEESAWSDTLEFTTKDQIGTPVALLPANASTENVLKPEFTWNSLARAVGYRLQLSKTSNFASLERDISTSSTNHTLTSNFELLTKYYWRLKAWDNDIDSSSFSTVWDFTTIGLKAPVQQSPVNNVAFVPINTSFSWLAADYAESYKIQISKSVTFGAIDFESTVTSTSYTPTSNLVAGKNYYWRILSKKGALESDWSSTFNFSTDFDITLVKPTNNSTNITRNNISFECQNAELADGYVFQAAKDAGFTNIVFEVTSSTRTMDYSYMNRKTKYYWRVKPLVGSEYGDWSTAWNFTTEEFNGPTLNSPANNTVDWEPPFELNWISQTEATQGYDIQISQSSTFSDIEYEILKNSTTSYIATELDRSIKYFWRVRAVNNFESSAWSSVWNVTTDIYDLPPDWDSIVTENTHSVRIPFAIDPQIVGRDLRKGDAIGAFYKDGSETKCCGYVIWNKVTAYLTIYGDDPATTPKEGYLENDLLEYKLFDCLTNNSYDALVSYSSGPEIFEIDGSSVFSELKTAIIKQDIVLSKGWNMISTNLNLYDNDIPDVWYGYSTNLVIMKNVAGSFFIPGTIDQIKKWNKKLGYLVYMSLADKLTLTGSDLQPDTVDISLSNGWSIVSYLRNSEMDVPTALATINDNLVIAKDNTGKFYLPATGTNTIGNLKMGQGYKLYMRTSDVLTYPANGGGKRNVDNTISKVPVRLIPKFAATANNATLIITVDAPDDSEIGIYSSNNLLVGSGVVESGLAAITIIGNDEMTDETDGAKLNEILSAKILLPNDNELRDIETQAIVSLIDGSKSNSIIYNKDEVLSANSKITLPTMNSNGLSIYPNPTEKNIYIDLKTDNKNEQVKIEIYTENGKLVHTILDKLDNNGNLILEYKTGNLAAGLYLLKIEFNKTELNNKFIKK